MASAMSSPRCSHSEPRAEIAPGGRPSNTTVGAELVVLCWFSHGPRANDPNFDPQPDDHVLVGDDEEARLRGGLPVGMVTECPCRWSYRVWPRRPCGTTSAAVSCRRMPTRVVSGATGMPRCAGWCSSACSRTPADPRRHRRNHQRNDQRGVEGDRMGPAAGARRGVRPAPACPQLPTRRPRLPVRSSVDAVRHHGRRDRPAARQDGVPHGVTRVE